MNFGDVSSCTAPKCDAFGVTAKHVAKSLKGFTKHKGRSLVTETVQYYGNWWKSTVGVGQEVPENFCISGAGAGQTSVSKSFTGVTFTAGSGSYTLESASTPHHDVENYCSAEGSHTPPLIGTDFESLFSKTFAMAPSSRSRADISNEVGYAVNGVVIFSPFTGIGTVAAYDETLDTCNGHPAGGKYHYHGFSSCLHSESGLQTGSAVAHSKIYGWAFDGFPIYGPYGYSDGNDISSTIVRVTGGYICDACATNGQKAVKSNWVYDGSGMLDDCNGRWTKTPEFPDGMYVYVLNIQSNGSPDFPGVPYCYQSTTTGTVAVSSGVTTISTTTTFVV